MKIGPPDTKIAPLQPAPERKGKGSPAVSASLPAAEPSAKVALSSAAAGGSATGISFSGDGSFDSAKVERIAQAIRDGKFTVNPKAIAEKLILNAEELLTRGKSN
jgi:negative regulator of flagellin synthesis FlgM